MGFRLLIAGISLFFIAWGVGIAFASRIGTGEDTARISDQATDEGAADVRDVSRPSNGPCALQLVCVVDEYEWDIYDKRSLISYSEHVFAGRVTAKAGTKAAKTSIPGDEETPHTQCVVEVLSVVKSEGKPEGPKQLLTGDRATIDQLGGPGAKTGKRHVAAPLYCNQQSVGGPLAVGDEYLFATRYDADTGYYDVSAPPAGAEPVSSVGAREDTLTVYRRAADSELDPLAGGENICQ